MMRRRLGEINVCNTKIETSRVILRAFTINDLDDYFEFASQEEVGENAGWARHENIKQSRQKLKMLIKSKIVFAIEEKTLNKVVGSFTVSTKSIKGQGDNGIEFGFVLSKDYWGQGIMSEVIKSVINHAFDNTTIEFIYIEHMNDNKRSQKLIEKAGFVYYQDSTYISSDFNNIPIATKCYILNKRI